MLSVEELNEKLIDLSFAEDIGDGDHTTLSTIPADAMGKNMLLIKEDGVLAGVDMAKRIFARFDKDLQVEVLIEGVQETLEALSEHYNLVVATKGDVTEQMNKYRRSGLDRYFHHCEVMENKDERNYLELAAKNNLAPEEILMIGNSVKSDIAPVVNIGGIAINTPHEVVWVHEMMDMPESDRIIIVKNIREVLNYLL